MLFRLQSNNIVINHSGQNGIKGQDGANGHHGCGSGQHGQRGGDAMPGTDGQNASNINLQLKAEDDKIITTGVQSIQNGYLQLGDSQNEFNLYSNGGLGGQGGRGGRGGDGADGHNGISATRYTSGTSGGNGGNGGDGGSGGRGGKGGDGGYIKVQSIEFDMDLFMLINKVSYMYGKGGTGGQGGQGGSGGCGGIGGSSYSWTTQDSNGNTSYHSNPGGFNGCHGSSGSTGAQGKDGNDGKIGDFQFHIQDTDRYYKSRYNLILIESSKTSSDDGIIEPGEFLFVDRLVFVNNGSMYSPVHQQIKFGLLDNRWIHFEKQNELEMKNSIQTNEQFITNSDLKFQVKRYNCPAQDTTFKEIATLEYFARVSRVEKYFPDVFKYTDKFEVRYPVEISQIVCAKSITIKEESPFAVGILNRSLKNLGYSEGRVIRLTLQLIEGEGRLRYFQKNYDIFEEFKDQRYRPQSIYQENAEDILQENKQQLIIDPSLIIKPIVLEIQQLQAQEQTIFSGSLKFNDLTIPNYTKSQFVMNLEIGSFENPMEYKLIQQRYFSLQLAESFTYNPQSLFLLVVNCQTTKEEIDAWKQIAIRLGSTADIWNISNQEGISFKHPLEKYDRCLNDMYKNKIVIFLNNTFPNNQNIAKSTQSYLGERELFDLAQNFNIRSYVIGPIENFNLKLNCGPYTNYFQDKQFININDLSQQVEEFNNNQLGIEINQKSQGLTFYTQDVIQNYYCCSSPQEQDLIQYATDMCKQIKSYYPLYQFVAVYNYNEQPELIEQGTLKKKIKIGKIEIRPGLPNNKVKIIQRFKQNQDMYKIDEGDVYNCAKLFPFQQKLDILGKINNQVTQQLFIKAILADLTDEIMAFSMESRMGRFNNELLRANLQHWNVFANYNFDTIFNKNLDIGINGTFETENKEFLNQNNDKQINQELIQQFVNSCIEYSYFLENLPTCYQVCCCSRISKTSKICLTIINQFLNQYSKQELIQQQKFTIKNQYKNVQAQILILQFQFPYQNVLKQSTFQSNFEMTINQIFKNQTPFTKPEDNVIQENQYKYYDSFSGNLNMDKRINHINDYEKQIKYDQ